MYHEALGIRRKLLGNEHPDVANSLNDLGLFFCGQRKLADAVAAHREALAALLRDQGKSTEAEALWLEALAIRRKLLGDEHPDLADTLHNLASLIRDQGRLAAAQSLYREAVAIRRKRSHPALPDELVALALALREPSELPEAEALLREALEIQSKPPGNPRSEVVSWLGELSRVLRAQGKLTEAEAVERESLAINKAETDKKAAAARP
jgi:tetratricopeptide (TPR) repeat protein